MRGRIIFLWALSFCACSAVGQKASVTTDSRESIRDEIARLTPERVKQVELLANDGNPRAMMVFSAAVKQGIGTPLDSVRAFALLTQAAEKGYAPAQNEVGSYYMLGRGGIAKDAKTALAWFSKAAVQGYPDGEFNIGLMEVQGLLGTPDWTDAITHFRAAAKQGHATAGYVLARALRDGEHTKPDPQESMRWLQMSAQAGEASAQLDLGSAFYTGSGVTKDEKTALEWFLRAADQNSAQAQMNCALMFHQGLGTEVDTAKAAYWYRRAAANGNPTAMRVLGALYADGRVLKQNLVAAVAFFLAAKELGDAKSAELLEDARKQLTPEQNAEAAASSVDYLAKIGRPKREVVAAK